MKPINFLYVFGLLVAVALVLYAVFAPFAALFIPNIPDYLQYDVCTVGGITIRPWAVLTLIAMAFVLVWARDRKCSHDEFNP